MSITIASGGFDGTIRSDSGGNIFIETAGNNKSINIGGLIEYTGSIEKRLDKATGKVIEETEKDIASGKTFHRSASATTNQIEFQQNSSGAFISVSGSNPGFTCFMPGVGDRAIRARGDIYVSASQFLSTGVNMDGSSLDYYIQMNHIGALATTHDFGDANGTGYLMVSQSGDTKVSKNLIVDGGITATTLTATSLNVTSITSSIVTSSTIQTEGSNIFGDTAADSHTFNGHITASGNISGSSTSTISVGGAIHGKQTHMTFHNYNNTGTDDQFIPSPAGYVIEGDTVSYIREWIAPYDGRLVKVIVRPSTAMGDTTVALYTDGSQQGICAATAITRFETQTISDFTDSGNANYSSGERLAINIDPTTAPTNVNVTCVWEYVIDE